MRTLSNKEIHRLMVLEGIDPIGFCADGVYVLPLHAWVTGVYSMAVGRFMHAFNMPTLYNPAETDSEIKPILTQDSDCDEYAIISAAFAKILHRNTPGHPNNTGLAFGEFWYRRDSGIGHALNCYFCIEEDTPTLKFFDPIRRCGTDLTISEVVSCSFYRF